MPRLTIEVSDEFRKTVRAHAALADQSVADYIVSSMLEDNSMRETYQTMGGQYQVGDREKIAERRREEAERARAETAERERRDIELHGIDDQPRGVEGD